LGLQATQTVVSTASAAAVLVATTVRGLMPWLVWNTSESAPIGLYRVLTAGKLMVNDLVIVIAPKPLAATATNNKPSMAPRLRTRRLLMATLRLFDSVNQSIGLVGWPMGTKHLSWTASRLITALSSFGRAGSVGPHHGPSQGLLCHLMAVHNDDAEPISVETV
jgi:hypothetical protein